MDQKDVARRVDKNLPQITVEEMVVRDALNLSLLGAVGASAEVSQLGGNDQSTFQI